MMAAHQTGKSKMKNGQKDLVEQVRQFRLQTEELEKQAKDLEKKVQLARGTQRIKRETAKTTPGRPHLIVKPSRSPYWTGNEGTTRDLMDVIERMLVERPWFYRDIVEATEAGENRIKGAITALQREGRRVVDVAPEGTGRALWFIPSEEVMTRIMHAKQTARARK
jgi:hypothetical protein